MPDSDDSRFDDSDNETLDSLMDECDLTVEQWEYRYGPIY